MSPSVPNHFPPTAIRSGIRRARRLGLAAWKKGDTSDAAKLFNQIANDGGAPANLRQRAEIMLSLLRADGVKVGGEAAG